MKKICLLKGGTSSEREISFLSAKEVAGAIKKNGYEFTEYDFNGDLLSFVSFLKNESVDCVYNSLHGGSGENGNIQAILNLLKIPYTHSGVSASAIGMDKMLSRDIFIKNKLRVPYGFVAKWNDLRALLNFESKMVIKPVSGGSSAGVYIIENISDLNGINWQYGENVLVEKYISGLELTVGVMQNKAIEVTEISVQSNFYDFHNKYEAGCSVHELPAAINSDVRKEALEMAMQAHNIVGCRGISRSDFRYDDVENKLYILELNTQPGMTTTSLLPEQANYIGISYTKLVQIMVEEACLDIY